MVTSSGNHKLYYNYSTTITATTVTIHGNVVRLLHTHYTHNHFRTTLYILYAKHPVYRRGVCQNTKGCVRIFTATHNSTNSSIVTTQLTGWYNEVDPLQVTILYSVQQTTYTLPCCTEKTENEMSH